MTDDMPHRIAKNHDKTGVPAYMPPKPCRAPAVRPDLVHGPIPGHQGVRVPGVTEVGESTF